MYEKITQAMNMDERFEVDFEVEDIERYLRNGTHRFVNAEEGAAIDEYLDQFL